MNRRILALLLALVMVAGLMTGCASGRQEAAAPETTQTESPAAEETAAEPEQTEESPAEEEAPAEPETVSFTDSLGRTVELPADITRIAPSGAVATMILAAIAPECMVTINTAPSESQMAFLPANLAALPETGQMYGSKANLNLETLLAADPQVVIDLGDKKGDMAEDLDALQAQIGIPVVFIEADLAHMAAAFRTLGGLLSGKSDRGEELAALVDRTTAIAEENTAKITDDMRVRAMYTTGEDGLGTNAAGSMQAQVLDMVGVENAVVVEDVSNKGGGNVISLEQLYNFDPDVILFSDGSIYSTVTDDSAWSQLTAISTGKYYEVPGSPYSWLSGPPSMNMILGVWWLGNLIYPEIYDYDMETMTQELYKTLWGYELSSEEVTALLGNSTLKAAAQ